MITSVVVSIATEAITPQAVLRLGLRPIASAPINPSAIHAIQTESLTMRIVRRQHPPLAFHRGHKQLNFPHLCGNLPVQFQVANVVLRRRTVVHCDCVQATCMRIIPSRGLLLPDPRQSCQNLPVGAASSRSCPTDSYLPVSE
jgi:hypothetical protein